MGLSRRVGCPLGYLIAIHVIAVGCLAAVVLPWFGFRLSRARVDVASGVLVENGWWGEDWKMTSGSDQGSGWLKLGPYLRRYVRVIDASGKTVMAAEIDRDGHASHLWVSPAGQSGAWSFFRTGRSSSGWSLGAWFGEDGSRAPLPHEGLYRFTVYRDADLRGYPDERTIREEPWPAPVQRHRLRDDAWVEVVEDASETAADGDGSGSDGESDGGVGGADGAGG
ncbi:MAG: hypothetical protein ACTS3F_01895 [Phycisphaerales bacterium]